jgi:hypothetical protein
MTLFLPIRFGRGRYKEAAKFGARNSDELPKWELLRYLVFDFPDSAFCDLPFEERYERLIKDIPSGHPFAISTED